MSGVTKFEEDLMQFQAGRQVCLECLRWVPAGEKHPCEEECIDSHRADDDGMAQ